MRFTVTYATYAELAADVQQMAHGGVLVRDPSPPALAFDTPIELALVMPDGTTVESTGKVLQVLAGHGVAVTLEPRAIEKTKAALAAGKDAPAPAVAARPTADEPTQAQKIHLAMHGNRDQRNAILRDKNRSLHVYVLKNPGITADDVLAIAKNPMMGPEMYKQIAERPAWFQKPEIAVALARNPKVPGEIALRALAFVAPDALRQLAKGTGAPPHVVQAARKRVIGK